MVYALNLKLRFLIKRSCKYRGVAKWLKAHGFDPCIRRFKSYHPCHGSDFELFAFLSGDYFYIGGIKAFTAIFILIIENNNVLFIFPI